MASWPTPSSSLAGGTTAAGHTEPASPTFGLDCQGCDHLGTERLGIQVTKGDLVISRWEPAGKRLRARAAQCVPAPSGWSLAKVSNNDVARRAPAGDMAGPTC